MMIAILVLALAAAFAGGGFAYTCRRRLALSEAAHHERRQQLQRQNADLSAKLKEAGRELARKREFAEHIPVVAGKLAQGIPANALPPLAVRFAKTYFHARQVGYFVPVDGSLDYTLQVGVGFPEDWKGKVRLAADEGILGMALQRKVVIAKTDPLASAGLRPSRPSLERAGVQPDFVAPVMGLGGLAGAVVIAGSPFPLEEERVTVSMLADLLSGGLQRAALVDLSQANAWTDHMTGVANRLYFTQRFEGEIRRAQNYRQLLGLVMLDIDEFKKINDTYGHAAGDMAIRTFARIVRDVTRSTDLVCRYGGDEFIVLVTFADVRQVVAYIDLLTEKISGAEIAIPRHDARIRLTASGGVALFPHDGRSTTELLHAADEALYEAKRRGRNRILLAQSILRGNAAAPAEAAVAEAAAPGTGLPGSAPAAGPTENSSGTDGSPPPEAIKG